jgi:hypothetical protein
MKEEVRMGLPSTSPKTERRHFFPTLSDPMTAT